ncbi:MAG: aminotransferase class V-fold PLP-dependent enzyme [Proteobacteria bacterium]|nr:aminotransferase class V-fold PLP-dependent enzyme [Pseudomonadota bacterium]
MSVYSGFVILPEVREMMDYASRHCVPIVELQEAVGSRIAEIMGAESAMVTTGASGAMHAGTAACVAGEDPKLIGRLPDTAGMKNNVLVLKTHRIDYDHAVRAIGIEMVEVENLREMEAAINERTAMIFAVPLQARTMGGPSMEEIAEVGINAGVPLFCDAAAERPERPNRYLKAGYDLVCHSGGKPLFGPQSSGILMGNRDLIRKALLNTAPYTNVGRSLKVGKEEIMGTLVAVDLWFNGRDHDQEFETWEGYARVIVDRVQQVRSVTATLEPEDAFGVSPILTVSWDPNVIEITPDEISKALFEGEPRIRMVTAADGLGLGPREMEVRASGKIPYGMIIRPYTLQEGEAEKVAKRLHELLAARQ